MQHSVVSGYYEDRDPVLVAVDCIIFGFDQGGLKLLLLKRRMEPLRGEWSLIGSFIHRSESLDEAAARVLRELTGLSDVFLEQQHSFGAVNRDPGGRVISVIYFALIRINEYDAEKGANYEVQWFPIDALPPLILDHEEMVSLALAKLRRKARFRPIGFELLPEKFTMPQLKALYDAIYQSDLDRRNFRKKIMSMGILEKLNEKERGTSRKGAYLYRFNREKYVELMAKGFVFEV